MYRIVNMFAGDRERIRMSVSLLEFIIANLDGINDMAMVHHPDLNNCVNELRTVRDRLHTIDVKAITWQTPPGEKTPS